MSSEQLSLLGFEPVAPTNRLFFAIYPDADAAASLGDCAQAIGARMGFRRPSVRPDLLHVTLNHLGDYPDLPPDLLAKANEAGSRLKAAPFDVTFDRAGGFTQPFVLQGAEGLVGLKRFQKALGEAMAWAGLGRWVEKSFTPHVTLFYGEQGPEIFAVEPVTWTVKELVLVHSLIGQSRHIPLGRWLLQA